MAATSASRLAERHPRHVEPLLRVAHLVDAGGLAGTPRRRWSPPSPRGRRRCRRPPTSGRRRAGRHLANVEPGGGNLRPWAHSTAFSWTLAMRASFVASVAYSSDISAEAAAPRLITSVISSRVSAAGATVLSARSGGRPVLADGEVLRLLEQILGRLDIGRGAGARARRRRPVGQGVGADLLRGLLARLLAAQALAHLLDELVAVGLGALEGGGAGAELAARRVEAAHRVERLRRAHDVERGLERALLLGPGKLAEPADLGGDVVDRSGRVDRLRRAHQVDEREHRVDDRLHGRGVDRLLARSGRASCRPCGRSGAPASSRSRRR